ncbi:MAG: glucose-6-phosphate isomerase [bacterium]
MIKLNIENTKKFFSNEEYNAIESKVNEACDMLLNRTGLGNDYLGWLDLPMNMDTADIIETANSIRSKCNTLVVIGIGGSYLGAASVIEAHKKYFNNEFEVVFCGEELSSDYLSELCEYLENRDFCINVISKSGTTIEPAITFRVLKKLIENKYGECSDRIFATTDKEKGALITLAKQKGYKTFVVPDDVGGRFSVLSAVGLLPIACSGVDINQLLSGAKEASKNYLNKNNDAVKYALIRNVLHLTKDIEIFVTYEPKLKLLAEWWKQLFGESEGKENKGIYVSSANFTTDLHSMGQMIQDGKRNLFETVIKVNKSNKEVVIPTDEEDLDGLNFLSCKTLHYVNEQAMEGTILAHVDGEVPNIIIELDSINPYTIGELIYFFEVACGVSAYTLGVNPFDQPGVEAYKKNMFALLNKPGYEELRKKLKNK